MTEAVRGRIRRLPDHLVNKIAAGEVVERPASVLKELVENALDAGARTVTIDLRDGGTSAVRVTDDGSGMTGEELELALERHATSKLAHDEDLDAIETLGFRGEALPAICAVSRFTITTAVGGGRGADRTGAEGTRIAGEGGVIRQRLAVPAVAGTTVDIADVFFNTPARLKFLKSAATELAVSVRAVTALAIAHPGVQFRLSNNGRAVVTAPAARDLRARMGALWGHEVAARLLAVDRAEHGVAIAGLVSPPDVTRGGRDDVVITVNGRPVRDPQLFHAVLEAYRPLLPRERFPLVGLALVLPAADVDVNVHPTKAWVRFRHPRLVHELLVAAVAAGLRRPSVVPEIGRPSGAASPTPLATGIGSATGSMGSDTQSPLFAETPAPYVKTSFGHVLGQVQDTFVVASSDAEVFFVDQHAAHERVLFDRLQAELASGPPASQELLFPEPLELGPADRGLLERWREPLERLGFAFERADGDSVVLRAVPALLGGDEPRRVVQAVVGDLAGARPGEPALDRILAFVACQAAIKANTVLERDEMERLLADLGATATPYFCPHGRPTMSRLSLADVRREVRRVW
jgi:DNA mismatch repair protein MutL